jgi:RNA-directed DNA polymerase
MSLLAFLRRLLGYDSPQGDGAPADPIAAPAPPETGNRSAATSSPESVSPPVPPPPSNVTHPVPPPAARPATQSGPRSAPPAPRPPKASQVIRPIDRATGAAPAPAPDLARQPPKREEEPSPPPSPPPTQPAAAVPPLKPDHRRLRITDPRLSNRPPSAQPGRRRPSKRVLPRDEAARLFSATLRTYDREARLLAADEAQLSRYGLPVWRNEADVARALDISLQTLRHFSMHAAQERAPNYVTFAIPKRRGGERLIMAPKRRLKALQRQLNALLCSKLPASEHAHGFRSGHSVRTNAQPHVGKRVVLHLDIREFFPSIHFGRVRGLLTALGYGYPVASALAALMTEAPRQPVSVGDTIYHVPVGTRACPQGAPTSPHISNALLVKMDHRLAGLARHLGFAYTRYADDLTFSGDDIAAAHALRLLTCRIVEEEGFQINPQKTRIMRAGARQCVTGVVVNDVLGLSRQTRRRLRAAIHRCALARAAGRADAATLARLEGELAYVAMLNPEQAQRLA